MTQSSPAHEALSRDDEVRLLRNEMLEMSFKVAEYHKGNTTLMEALLRLAVQPNEANLDNARQVLKRAGVMHDDDGANWAALDSRKASPMTWKDTVQMFVKQPTVRDQLLALDVGHPSPATASSPGAAPAETHVCDNCGKVHTEDELNEVKDYFARVDPGGTVPSGECADCGCLCYPR